MQKKISGKVGIVGGDKEPKKKRSSGRGAATMFWQALVKDWFDIYGELMPAVKDVSGILMKAEPVFDGPEARNMKLQVKVIYTRAIKAGVEWTEAEARKRVQAYIRFAWRDDFCSKNFCWRGFSVRKNQLFNNQITPKKDGTSPQHTVKRIEPTAQSERDFGEL